MDIVLQWVTITQRVTLILIAPSLPPSLSTHSNGKSNMSACQMILELVYLCNTSVSSVSRCLTTILANDFLLASIAINYYHNKASYQPKQQQQNIAQSINSCLITRCIFAGLMVSTCEFHSTDTAMAKGLLGTTRRFPAGVLTFLLSTVIW